MFTQIIDYILDIFEQELRDEEYINLINTLNNKFDIYDCNDISLDKDSIHQDISQNYELVKDYLSINKIKYYVYLIKIIIVFLISFYYSLEVAIIVFILSIISIILPNYFSKKLDINYLNFIDAFKNLQEYTINHFAINNETRFLKKEILSPINNLLEDYKQKSERKTRFESFFMNIISYGLINGSILAVIIVSGLLAINGKVEVGYIYVSVLYVAIVFTD